MSAEMYGSSAWYSYGSSGRVALVRRPRTLRTRDRIIFSEDFFEKKKGERVILMTTKAKTGLDVFKFKKKIGHYV